MQKPSFSNRGRAAGLCLDYGLAEHELIDQKSGATTSQIADSFEHRRSLATDSSSESEIATQRERIARI
jgi:hypothetical protein